MNLKNGKIVHTCTWCHHTSEIMVCMGNDYFCDETCYRASQNKLTMHRLLTKHMEKKQLLKRIK